MAAALAGGVEVAPALPLCVDEVDSDTDVARVVPLFVAKFKGESLKLKMLVNCDNEVFQQWEHREEDEQESSSWLIEEALRGGVSTGGTDPAGGQGCLEPLLPAATGGTDRGGGRARGKGGGGRGEEKGVGRGRDPLTFSPCVPHRTGQIKAYNKECERPLVYHFFYRDPPAFDLDDESTIPPARHTSAPATELEWSANVLSFKVVSSTVGYPVNLYGSVYVRDDLDCKRVYLFRRDRDNGQVVKNPEETLVLTGPSRGLLVFDNLFFEVDLKMRCDRQVDDMNFSQGFIQYSHVANVSSLLAYSSCLLTDELTTKVSTMELQYAPV